MTWACPGAGEARQGRGAIPAAADDGHGLVPGDLCAPCRELGARNAQGLGDMALPPFLGLAHIEHHKIAVMLPVPLEVPHGPLRQLDERFPRRPPG